MYGIGISENALERLGLERRELHNKEITKMRRDLNEVVAEFVLKVGRCPTDTERIVMKLAYLSGFTSGTEMIASGT